MVSLFILIWAVWSPRLAMDDWIVRYDYAPDTATMVVGKEVCLVARPVCLDFQANLHCMVTVPLNKSFRFQGSLEPNMVTYSLMRVRVEKDGPTPLLITTDNTCVWGHKQCTWEDAMDVMDLCSGMGGMGQGAKAAMFQPVVACDLRPRMLELYALNSKAKTISGDITKISTLNEVYKAHPQGTTLAAGVSCQPYSKLGDGRSGDDERSLTLPAVLAAAHFLRSMAVVLECVEPAGQDAYVRWHVDQFCLRTGFHKAETILHLHEVWPCKRSRWWCVLTAPAIGPVDLRPFPKIPDLPTVRHVFPATPAWDVDSEKALMLSAVEIEAFSTHGGGCDSHVLNFAGVMPCALHAWGSQVTPCPCGCRMAGLSASRLSSRGLHGALVRSACQEGTRIKGAFRHLHPQEAACLCGMDAGLQWGAAHRLALGAVGQFASPIQAMWVFQQVRKQFEIVKTGSWTVQPYASLLAYRSWLVARSRHVWDRTPKMYPVSECLNMSLSWDAVKHLAFDEMIVGSHSLVHKLEQLREESKPVVIEPHSEQSPESLVISVDNIVIPTPTEECDSAEAVSMQTGRHVEACIRVIQDDVSTPPVLVKVPVGMTIKALVRAELAFQHCNGPHVILLEHGGEVGDDEAIVADLTITVQLRANQVNECSLSDTSEVDAAMLEDRKPLLRVKDDGFLDLEGPQVTLSSQAQALRAQTMQSSDRVKMLKNQGTVWGDDELVGLALGKDPKQLGQ